MEYGLAWQPLEMHKVKVQPVKRKTRSLADAQGEPCFPLIAFITLSAIRKCLQDQEAAVIILVKGCASSLLPANSCRMQSHQNLQSFRLRSGQHLTCTLYRHVCVYI